MPLFFSGHARAADVEKLVMPGPVIEGHAKYESDCGKCHGMFSKESQSQRCRACHDKIDADITKKTGYHGHNKNILNHECKSCHTEHQGRKADVIQMNRETFDHSLTDFPLRRSHTEVLCVRCHKEKTAFRDAPTNCFGCHKKDDIHRGRLGEKCADCHNEGSWRKADFDHDKTDFPLKGAHRDTACGACHTNDRYETAPTTCFACHRLTDIHKGRYGEKCETCHNSVKWKEWTFDHDKSTDYKLTGRHAKAACDACHTGDLYKDKTPTDCFTCHKHDDAHKARYGGKCEDCHTTSEWGRARFDHDKDTKFPLHGKHQKVSCDSCHPGDMKDKLEGTCFSCHRHDDPHHEEQGKRCESCHSDTGWPDNIRFDHDVTHFPLIGLHATVPCEECHINAVFKKTDSACVDCHKGDDTHKRRLGPACELCHTPNGWKIWRFDHDKQTRFVLDGAHKGIDCLACHKTATSDRPTLQMACGSCHRDDDIHDGQFGQWCERCHTTKTFKDATLLN